MADATAMVTTMAVTTLDPVKGMREIGEYVWQQARAAIEARGVFVIAVSGGSLPANLATGLEATASAFAALCPADRWKIVYADERFVPLDDADSNHAATIASLTGSGKVLEGANLIPIDPSQASVDDCATDYAAKLSAAVSSSSESGIPVLDLVLLGMGPDGHTASLFPGHPLLDEMTKPVAAISDSPKPPLRRVTLTLPVLNASRAVAFICTGAAKADALASVQAAHQGKLPPGQALLPSARVHHALWFIDAAAATGLAAETA